MACPLPGWTLQDILSTALRDGLNPEATRDLMRSQLWHKYPSQRDYLTEILVRFRDQFPIAEEQCPQLVYLERECEARTRGYVWI